MDLIPVLHQSRLFYREHQLADWAETLPHGLPLLQGTGPLFQQAFKAGFTRGFAFPPFALQMATLDRLIEETARKPAPGLPDTQQYQTEPFLADTWSKTPNGKVLQRTDNLEPRTDGPYVLLLGAAPVQAAWGRTGKQIAELFLGKGWSGLTVPEYLVLQRFFCERHGDHRFFDTPLDESGAHWLWLVDSMTDTEMAVAMGSPRGINLQACKLNNREAKRAAVAGLVLSLEGEE